MFVRGEIATRGRRRGLAVPDEAIQREGERTVVYVQTSPETFAERAVRLGRKSGERMEVLEGLRPGERIAVAGTFRIKSVANSGEIQGDDD